MPSDTTFVLTSCDRPDLLAATLESIEALDQRDGIVTFVIIETSAMKPYRRRQQTDDIG